MRISDWSSDVCSSDLALLVGGLMLAVAGALWARRRLPDGFRLATPAAVGLLTLAAFLLPVEMSERPAAAESEVGEGLWRRSEERRVGNECVRTCRSRWSQYH